MKIVKSTKGKYPNTSCKDAVVPPRYPVPKCPCGRLCEISQSKHPATAGRAFYMCSDSRVSFLVYFLYISVETLLLTHDSCFHYAFDRNIVRATFSNGLMGLRYMMTIFYHQILEFYWGHGRLRHGHVLCALLHLHRRYGN